MRSSSLSISIGSEGDLLGTAWTDLLRLSANLSSEVSDLFQEEHDPFFLGADTVVAAALADGTAAVAADFRSAVDGTTATGVLTLAGLVGTGGLAASFKLL
jgi:hypothetical protein